MLVSTAAACASRGRLPPSTRRPAPLLDVAHPTRHSAAAWGGSPQVRPTYARPTYATAVCVQSDVAALLPGLVDDEHRSLLHLAHRGVTPLRAAERRAGGLEKAMVVGTLTGRAQLCGTEGVLASEKEGVFCVCVVSR